MADEEKKEEAAPAPDAAKKEGEKKEGAEGAADAPKAKSKISVLHIGLGGGAAAVIAMAYFLTVAAIQTGDAAHQALQEQMKNPTATPSVDEHGNPIDPEHGKEEKKEEEHKEEGGHGEEGGGEHGEAGKEGANAEPKGPGTAYIKLDEIKINPNQAGLKRFLLVQFGFAFESEDASGLAAKLQSEDGLKGPIKHRLIRLLKSKTVDDLDGDAHTNLLLREVREIINQELFADGKGKVTGVFLEQFIVQ